jgi:hypothetical protein
MPWMWPTELELSSLSLIITYQQVMLSFFLSLVSNGSTGRMVE